MSDNARFEQSELSTTPSELPQTADKFRNFWKDRYAGYGLLPPQDYSVKELFGYFSPAQHQDRVEKISELLLISDGNMRAQTFRPHGNIRTPLEELRALEQVDPDAFLHALIGISKRNPEIESMWQVAQTAEEAHLGVAFWHDFQQHAAINAVATYLYEIAMARDLENVFRIADRFLTTETGIPFRKRFSVFDISDTYRDTLFASRVLDRDIYRNGEANVTGSIKSSYSLMRRVVTENEVRALLSDISTNQELRPYDALRVVNEHIGKALSGETERDGYEKIAQLIAVIEQKMSKRNDVVRGRLVCNTVSASENLIDQILAIQERLRKTELKEDPRLDSFILDVEDRPGHPQERLMVRPLGLADSSLRPFGPTVTKMILDRLMTREDDVSMWLAFHGYFPAYSSNGVIHINGPSRPLGRFGLEIQVFPPGTWIVNDAHRQKFIGRDFDADFDRLPGVFPMQLDRAKQFAKQVMKGNRYR